MAYAKLFKSKAVILDMDAADPDAVLGVLVDGLIKADAGLKERRDELLAALREREARGSTASQGVALPHVMLPGLEKVSISVAIHREGTDFRALDGERVHVFFGLVRPEKDNEEHLAILRWLAGIARHHDFVPFALQATSPKQFIELLTELAAA